MKDSTGNWAGQSWYLMAASRKGVDNIEIGIEGTVDKSEGKLRVAGGFAMAFFGSVAAEWEGQVRRKEGTIFIMDLTNEEMSLVPTGNSSLRIIG
jgi:hypothetical protein